MIETGSQRFLKSSSAEIETLTQPFFPIGCPGKDDTAWIEVQTKTLEVYETLLSDLKEKGLEVGDIKDALPKNYRKVDYFVADYHAHVSQVLQVINKVLLSVGTEEQINTIVFLDKSGRIVAHLFKSMWNDLVNMGLINRSDKCPKIRFLNDGYDNWQKRKRISSMHVIDYIKRIAGRSSVLIVDEVISSGTTIRSALDNFEIAGVNILGGMSAYHFTPQWYGENDGVKGVDDVPIQEETYDAFEKLSEREFIFFKDIINRLRESNLFEEII